MLNQIQGIVDQIIAAEEGLETLSEQVEGIERSSLQEALRIASKSLPFQRLTASASIHNCDFCFHPNQFAFMDKKGVCLAIPDNGSQEQDGEAIDEEELWLLDTGAFIITHRKGYKSNRPNEWWSWTREVIETGVDPLETTFGVEEIFNNLLKHLGDRLNELSDSVKTQKELIKKLQALNLH